MALLSLKEQRALIAAGMVREDDYGPVVPRWKRLHAAGGWGPVVTRKRRRGLRAASAPYRKAVGQGTGKLPAAAVDELFALVRGSAKWRHKWRQAPPRFRFGVVRNGALVFKTEKIAPSGWYDVPPPARIGVPYDWERRPGEPGEPPPNDAVVVGNDYWGRAR